MLPAFAGSYDDDEKNSLTGHTYFKGEIINPTCQIEINKKDLINKEKTKSINVEFIYYNCNEDSLENLDLMLNQISYNPLNYDDVILAGCNYKSNDFCEFHTILNNREKPLNGLKDSIEDVSYKKFIVRYDIKYNNGFAKGKEGIASDFLCNYQ